MTTTVDTPPLLSIVWHEYLINRYSPSPAVYLWQQPIHASRRIAMPKRIPPCHLSAVIPDRRN